jgi:phage tail sheath protein FI
MSTATAIPGLYYTAVRPLREPSPLRTDVAGMFGRTRRGPAGRVIRVEGWREFMAVFGGLTEAAVTPYALRGYFDNGGQVAYVVRLLGGGSKTASAWWDAGIFDPGSGTLDGNWPGASGLPATRFEFKASSPGDWANETMVRIRYSALGPAHKPEIELETAPPDETMELLTGIDPKNIVDEVNARSAYLSLRQIDFPAGLSAADLTSNPGPRHREWSIKLAGGTVESPTKLDYLAAVQSLENQSEVALVASPDLYEEQFPEEQFPDRPDEQLEIQLEVLNALLNQAEQLHDRLVIIDVPPAKADPLDAVNWIQVNLREPLSDELLRNAAVYHPRLLVPDPLGGISASLRCVPCSGLVAGVISRLDLQNGAYLTPANAAIDEAVDLSRSLDADEQTSLYSGGINLLTCSPGRGLLVWGGRVLGKGVPGGYVAHRRLVHLLVRAIRRVAEPLVFDTNGPELWLAFLRSVTSVLLAAYRAGALKGSRPEEAFRVACDATTNPPENLENGLVICEIQVAPAIPMEFITLRVAASAEGKLEVFES